MLSECEPDWKPQLKTAVLVLKNKFKPVQTRLLIYFHNKKSYFWAKKSVEVLRSWRAWCCRGWPSPWSGWANFTTRGWCGSDHHMIYVLSYVYHIYILYIWKDSGSSVVSLLQLMLCAPFVLLGKSPGGFRLKACWSKMLTVTSNDMLTCTHSVCWTVLVLNTAPQFVGDFPTHWNTNTVEMESHYMAIVGFSVDLCTGLMACSFTSVAQPQMLIKHSSNFAHSRLSRLNLLLHRDQHTWTGML